MKLWFLILFSLVLSWPMLAKEKDNRLYLKPKTIVGNSEIRLSDFTNWKGNWNPVLFQNLQSPLVMEPETLKESLNARYRKETGEEVSFEVMGKEGILLPKTSVVGRKDLERSLWKELQESVDGSLGEEGNSIRLSSEKDSIQTITGTKLVWRNTGRTLHAGKRLFPLDYYFEGKMVHSESIPFLIEEKKKSLLHHKRDSIQNHTYGSGCGPQRIFYRRPQSRVFGRKPCGEHGAWCSHR